MLNYLLYKLTLTKNSPLQRREFNPDHKEGPTSSEMSVAVIMLSISGNLGLPWKFPNLSVKFCHLDV